MEKDEENPVYAISRSFDFEHIGYWLWRTLPLIILNQKVLTIQGQGI